MNMKKKNIIALAVSVLLAFSLAACAKKDVLVCGITEFDPMNYRDAGGNWTGFDTEFALMVGEKLGMEVKFQEIEWAQKYAELEAGSIRCIWNGFTANASEADGTPRNQLVDMSYSYMLNQQCIVIKTERGDEFTDIDSLIGKSVAVEKGSAGEAEALTLIGEGAVLVPAAAQINTFIEVLTGAVDFAVVDLLLAEQLTGRGDYASLRIADITLSSEVYAVGFKKGYELRLRGRVNQAMKELYDEGKLDALAAKYGLENSLSLDVSFR